MDQFSNVVGEAEGQINTSEGNKVVGLVEESRIETDRKTEGK